MPRPWLRAATGALSVAWILAFPALPSAAAGQDADALVEQGVRLREAGRDEEAVRTFRQAIALEQTPRIEAQLGLALLATGEFVEAHELLAGAIATRDPWIESRRSALEASFQSAAQHVGLVEVTGGVPGARVSVNGRAAGTLPLAGGVRAAAGRAVVDVALEGYRTFSAEVAVQPGMTSRVRAELLRPVLDPAAATTDDGWLWPVIVVVAALVVGGVVTGLAIGLQQPTYERPDVGGVVMTLQGAW